MTITQSIQKTGEFSTHYALACFAIGTFLLLTYLHLPHSENVLILGFCFFIVAVLTNLILLAHLVYQFLMKPYHREYFAIKILILLANIPVTYVYLQFIK